MVPQGIAYQGYAPLVQQDDPPVPSRVLIRALVRTMQAQGCDCSWLVQMSGMGTK